VISRIVVLVLLASSYLTVQGADAASKSDNAKIGRARLTLRSFFTSYEHRNVAGVFASLAKNGYIGDCDYAHHVMVERYRGESNGHALSNWLHVQFSENDHLNADVTHATIDVENGFPVALIPNRRVSDSLAPLLQRGSLDFSIGFKFIFNQRGNRISTAAMSSQTECPAGTLPRGAQPALEQALAQSFLAAYNSHNQDAVVNLLTDTVSYRDCDYKSHSHKLLSGPAEVAAWLEQRFAENDRLSDVNVVLDSWFSQFTNPPTTIVIRALRQSTTLDALSPSPHATTLVLLPNSPLDRIQSVSVSESCN
jgi:hypothetical protein